MKDVFILTVGKFKESDFLSIQGNYLKRLKQTKVEFLEIKSSNLEKEWNDIQTKIKNITKKRPAKVFYLEETGKQFQSKEFAKSFYLNDETYVFVIGGAYGFPKNKKKEMEYSLSLSKFTLPHRFARLILIEQIYRWESLHLNHPYHNE